MKIKVAVVRARMKDVTRRLEVQLARLDRTFPRVDLAENYGDACEVIRNLATAVKYAASFAAMSDEGIQREIDSYGPAPSPADRVSDSRADGAAE